MPSFTGKTFANFYKNLLGINQTTNTGADATVRTVQDGAGNDTSLSLGTRNVKVINTTHNTTSAFTVANKGGDDILAVDTTNSKVLIGASQVAANTQYAYFGVSSQHALSAVAGTHYAIPIGNTWATTNSIAFGTGTHPSTSYDVSAIIMEMI